MEKLIKIIPKEIWRIKCPHLMTSPKYITIHNTANNASADNEYIYMSNNDKTISCHYYIDENKSLQALPLDRNGWHAGDGANGPGNRTSIGIEICRSTDYKTNNFNLAFVNAAQVTAQLMRDFNIPLDHVVQHNHWPAPNGYRKDCPHRIRAEGTWQKYLDLCQEFYEQGDENKMSYDVKVIRILKDKHKDYRCSVDGNKYGDRYDVTSLAGFGDKQLVAEGFKEEVCINGSIFYSWDGKHYAEGLEKSRGINNQEFEMGAVADFADTMAVGFRYDGGIDFEKQRDIQNNIDQYYGAVTGAFGIMKNGERCEWGRELESRRNYLYSKRAGRTILGYDSLNDCYIIISIAGVTGKSGPTGSELFGICKKHGCTEAINLDGSGSRKLRWKGSVVVDGSRKVKNAILIYSKDKAPHPEPEPDPKPEPLPDSKEYVVAEKLGLNIRESLSFKNGRNVGKILDTIPKGDEAEVVDFIEKIQSDGYQWVKVSYNGTVGYCQLDTQCYYIKG